jgi:hypothetical protein
VVATHMPPCLPWRRPNPIRYLHLVPATLAQIDS